MASMYVPDGQSRRDRRRKRAAQRRDQRHNRRDLVQFEAKLGRPLVQPQLQRCRQCGQVFLAAGSPERERCRPCTATIFLPAVRSGLGGDTPAA